MITFNRRKSRCQACGAELIWLKTAIGSNMPTNADAVLEDDQLFDSTRHTSHFATCPSADKFRRPKSE